jgi:hypothetical protein
MFEVSMIISVQKNLQHYKLSVLDLDEVYFGQQRCGRLSNTALTVGPKLSMF